MDAKGDAYRLGEHAERHELAKDVAALANNAEGGVVMCAAGART